VREQRWLLPLVWFTVKTSIVADSATICVVVVDGCVVSVVNGLVVVVAISSLVYDICDSVDGSE
jgi:hypothetical protein